MYIFEAVEINLTDNIFINMVVNYLSRPLFENWTRSLLLIAKNKTTGRTKQDRSENESHRIITMGTIIMSPMSCELRHVRIQHVIKFVKLLAYCEEKKCRLLICLCKFFRAFIQPKCIKYNKRS